MFGWLGDAIGWVGDKITGALGSAGEAISSSIWDIFLEWLYTTIYGTVSSFFDMISGMGAGIFELKWVDAVVLLFSYIAWALFMTGLVIAIFDTAIGYQNGKSDIQSMLLNILKGFLAVNLFTLVPIKLYQFCVSLQSTFSNDIIKAFVSTNKTDLGNTAKLALKAVSSGGDGLLQIVMVLALAYCVVKLFFANIKRGGILLIQIAVGSLYMLSIPRGFADGFNSWCKQVIALCLTAFLQNTLLFLGLITCQTNTILGIGIMLSATEVPRIAQAFGLDTSVKVNTMSVAYTANTAMNVGKTIAGKII